MMMCMVRMGQFVWLEVFRREGVRTGQRVAGLSDDNTHVVNEFHWCSLLPFVQYYHGVAFTSIRCLRRRRRSHTLRALTRWVLQVFLPRYNSRTPRTPATVQATLFSAQVAAGTSLILVVFYRLTDAHLLFHFRLELSAYPYNLLRHVATPAVFVAWRLRAFSDQFIGAALVLSVHVLRCEARVAAPAFYTFVPLAQSRADTAPG